MQNRSIKIAIIGGGPMGLAISYRLSKFGYKTFLFEADDRLGGMTASINFSGLEIERYYHFHCLSDTTFINLLKELKLKSKLKWKKTSMGFFYQNKLFKWGSISSVLTFPQLSMLTKVRYILHTLTCLVIFDWKALDRLSASKWLRIWLGKKGYNILWSKLFLFKFYKYSDDISAAWIWSRIKRLGLSRKFFKEHLGFLTGGSKELIDSLEASILENGGKINTSTAVLSILPNEITGAKLITKKGSENFDVVISTIPLPLIPKLLNLRKNYQFLINQYQDITSIACACVLIRTNRKVTNNFWTNINDDRFDIPGIIEMSNLRELPFHLVYVPFYMPFEHQSYRRNDEDFISDAWECLKSLNPTLKDKDLIDSQCNRYRYAQPICDVNFKSKIPSLQPFKNLYILDTTFYYPEDRGINESLKCGFDLANLIMKNKGELN
tara:strand:- start:2220 stop:3533 length:1314 start_codon:yes stop_codon:yes gene_type:complete